MVYHFTNLNSFENIFKSIAKPKGRYLTFWASRIYEMNDPLEMVLGVPIIKEAISAFEEGRDIEEKYKLSTYQNVVKVVENTKSLDDSILIKHIGKYQRDPFILSFCRINEDTINNELPLWTTYGNSGEGICMGFDEGMFRFKEDADFKYSAYNIAYLVENMTERLNNQDTIFQMRTHFQNEYEKYLKIVHAIHNEEDILDAMRTSIASMASFVGAFTKVADYEYENEYRIAIFPKDDIIEQKRVNFRLSTSNNLISYICIPLPIESLKKIIVGPCVSDMTLNNLYEQMKTLGINVKPKKTDILFRNL